MDNNDTVSATSDTSNECIAQDKYLESSKEDGDIQSSAIQRPTSIKSLPKSSNWGTDNHGSIDLDEKFSSMTGSYSEILDDSVHEDVETPCGNPTVGDLFSRHAGRSSTERGKDTPICFEDEENDVACSLHRLHDQFREENIARFLRDFSDKASVDSQSSKRREEHIRGHNVDPSQGRTCVYPSCPPIDPSLIGDLEDHAMRIATSMDTLTENLTGTLHSISALSVDCMESYRDAVCKTCDALDSNIKSMYQLMAKCEELGKSMKSVYKLHDQIKEIRRLLDLFEGVVFSGGT